MYCHHESNQDFSEEPQHKFKVLIDETSLLLSNKNCYIVNKKYGFITYNVETNLNRAWPIPRTRAGFFSYGLVNPR